MAPDPEAVAVRQGAPQTKKPRIRQETAGDRITAGLNKGDVENENGLPGFGVGVGGGVTVSGMLRNRSMRHV